MTASKAFATLATTTPSVVKTEFLLFISFFKHLVTFRTLCQCIFSVNNVKNNEPQTFRTRDSNFWPLIGKCPKGLLSLLNYFTIEIIIFLSA